MRHSRTGLCGLGETRMDWTLWLGIAVALGGSYWVFHLIVQWILSDAPPGTRICGITSKKRRPD